LNPVTGVSMSRYLTTAEVAGICRTSPETIRYWRYVDKGPRSFKIGRRVLYDATAVEEWLAGQQDAQAIKAG
jgi:predicted DNA-binding transcriptional regulator AlpA